MIINNVVMTYFCDHFCYFPVIIVTIIISKNPAEI